MTSAGGTKGLCIGYGILSLLAFITMCIAASANKLVVFVFLTGDQPSDQFSCAAPYLEASAGKSSTVSRAGFTQDSSQVCFEALTVRLFA
jgi:hypothetical protein